MRYDKKEVDFEYYCPRCEHYETVETEEPCYECLEHCFNYNTKRPVCYEEKKAHIIEVDFNSDKTTSNHIKEDIL